MRRKKPKRYLDRKRTLSTLRDWDLNADMKAKTRASKAALLVFILVTSAPSMRAQSKQPIFFSYDKDNFTATGDWTPMDTKMKPPFPSETEIDCSKSSMACVEATAEFYGGHPHVTINYFQVIRWDNDGIIASDSSGICMTVTIQISFAEGRISSTHSLKRLTEKTKEACKFFGADKTEEDIFVLKGSERWTKEHSLVPQK
jgi:hypothetical protein